MHDKPPNWKRRIYSCVASINEADAAWKIELGGVHDDSSNQRWKFILVRLQSMKLTTKSTVHLRCLIY